MRCEKLVSAPACRTLMREWIGRGASERHALAAIGMSDTRCVIARAKTATSKCADASLR